MPGELLNQLFLIFVGILGTAITGAIISHFRKKSQCFTQLKNQSNSQEQDIKIIKKTLIIMSKMIDTQTNIAHSDAHLELENLTKEMLDEE